jgi:hypothetical protein
VSADSVETGYRRLVVSVTFLCLSMQNLGFYFKLGELFPSMSLTVYDFVILPEQQSFNKQETIHQRCLCYGILQ